MITNIVVAIVSFLSMVVALVAAGRADTHRILARDAQTAAEFACNRAEQHAASAEGADKALRSVIERPGSGR